MQWGGNDLEGGVEVLDIDVLVGCCLALAPEQQTFLGGHLLHADVLDGEAQDDGPDHTQSHLEVAIHDFCVGNTRVNTRETVYMCICVSACACVCEGEELNISELWRCKISLVQSINKKVGHISVSKPTS